MRILIVDDHTLFREALVLLLAEYHADATLIQAASAPEALGAVELYADFDLILLDMALPGMDGLTLLPELRRRMPTSPIVVLSGTVDSTTARAVLAEGAMGFVHKSAGSQEMRNALDLVLRGEVYMPLSLLSADDEAAPPPGPGGVAASGLLTGRQLDVLRLLAEGLPNKRIARELDISAATVKLHVSAILRALHAANRTEAVLAAGRRGLLGDRTLPSAAWAGKPRGQ